MFYAAPVAGLSILFAAAALAQEKTELMYKGGPGLKVALEVEGTSEGHLLSDAPNMSGKFTLSSKEKRKLTAQAVENSGEGSGDTGDWKVTGELTSEMTFNGETRDPVTDSIGPMTFTLDQRGQVVKIKLEPFDATPQNLLRFRWWRYITQQLDLPPVLPEEPVAPGAAWKSVASLTGPDGKPLKASQEFRFLGTSDESEGQTAWLRNETVVPLDLAFKTDQGEYKVSGKLRIDRLFAFDIEQGLPRGNTNRFTVDMSITAKTSGGDEFRSQLYMHGDGKTVFKVDKAEEGSSKP